MPAHDVAEHLHEAPVGVPREALVAGRARRGPRRDSSLRPRLRTVSSMPGIDSRAPRAHGDEQRVVGVAELLAGLLLEAGRAPRRPASSRPSGTLAVAHVRDARLGRDREARGHALGAQDARHLRDVGALAAEQVAHLARPLGEVVDPLRRDLGRPWRARSYPARRRAQPDVRVMLDRLGDRALGLAQRALGRVGRLGERRAERAGEERVRRLVEREAAGLARAADDAAGGAREARRGGRCVAARRARGELRREAGGEQQLEAERELVGARRPRGLARRAARARCRAG